MNDAARPDGLGADRQPRCLLVEDNRLIALDLQELLEQEAGCLVSVVSSGATDALAAIESFRPDVVICDLTLLLTAHLKPVDVAGRHRLIVITGDSHGARDVGPEAGLLLKPFRNGELTQMVTQALAEGRAPCAECCP
jgi:CheY-like chemotaxis protein